MSFVENTEKLTLKRFRITVFALSHKISRTFSMFRTGCNWVIGLFFFLELFQTHYLSRSLISLLALKSHYFRYFHRYYKFSCSIGYFGTFYKCNFIFFIDSFQHLWNNFFLGYTHRTFIRRNINWYTRILFFQLLHFLVSRSLPHLIHFVCYQLDEVGLPYQSESSVDKDQGQKEVLNKFPLQSHHWEQVNHPVKRNSTDVYIESSRNQ